MNEKKKTINKKTYQKTKNKNEQKSRPYESHSVCNSKQIEFFFKLCLYKNQKSKKNTKQEIKRKKIKKIIKMEHILYGNLVAFRAILKYFLLNNLDRSICQFFFSL